MSSERGTALVIVLLVLLVVSGLATTMLVTGHTDHVISANDRDSERALFASKAGLAYAYKMFEDGLIVPTNEGAVFDSLDTDVAAVLEGAQFSGRFYKLGSSQGQLYAMESTGTFNRASRSTELMFQVIPELMRYGYIGFTGVTLHNHSDLAGPWFRIESTVFSNGDVSVPSNLTLAGAIVSAGSVSIDTGSTIEHGVYANQVSNDGTIEGDVTLITAVDRLGASAASWDRVDDLGNKYDWYDGNSTPGSLSGSGTVVGSTSSYTIQDGDNFKSKIIRDDGTLIVDPDINVAQYVPPPMIDYAAMKAEADKNDPTYFTSAAQLYAYLASKKVNETIAGYDVTTIRVGTPANPEFIYLDDSFDLVLDPTASADSGNTLKAHGLYIEGGMYVTGSWVIEEAPYLPAPDDYMPTPPDYYSFYINGLDYCYPAIMAYPEPSSGTFDTWVPSDTPPIGSGSSMDMKSGSPNGGFTYINGMIFVSAGIHLHHTANELELIRMNGAEVAGSIHNCDYLWFSYDPAVRCTKFLLGGEGEAGVVSYREVR